ncbi:MAG TPA: alpha/beta fold hydrolase [Thermoanaerobaculia bacterium]|nr:alpha/beta fold hydrolase [Thermoanaerobaculia bacterium]
MHKKLLCLLVTAFLATALSAQTEPATSRALSSHSESTNRSFEVMGKKIEDVLWHFTVGDIATVAKYRIASSKPRRERSSTAQGAGNPLILPIYVFAPKELRGKAPLIIYVHGGVHGDFAISQTHIVRELISEGYVVVAPEYRGSTGYGSDFYSQIDYGGAEVDDVKDARDWAVEMLPNVDAKRVGIIGWSHGGYQALLNIFQWPEAYQVAYAGVPVSDLVQRMGYKSQSYRDIFKEFIGKEAVDDPAEYRRRSPVVHAHKLATPLLIHTTTNDEDVNVMEVEHLISALKAAGKKFEYKIYQNAPGSHQFNRIDTRLARESRREIYEFLRRHLK